MPPASAGSGGAVRATSGNIISASDSAKARRMRGGMNVSPIPGSSMTMAPRRAKTRPAVKTC
jgi:hypothetical protein